MAYLSEARELGDRLVVGINSDLSTTTIKGPKRPINNQDSRLSVIAAMGCVDAVILFDELTPLELIKEISPDILVKGSDYKVNDIVGSTHVLSTGGEVKVIEFIKGYSSTNIINKIIENG